MTFPLMIAFIFISSGCTSYQIPLQTSSHPASSGVPVVQVELSPILNLSQEDHIENQGACDENHH